MRKAGHSGYTSDGIAAAVGAVGGIPATVSFSLLSSLFFRPSPTAAVVEAPPALIQLSSSIIIGTLSGAIGSSVIRAMNVYTSLRFDLKGFDVLHATRAGAVGGAIMTFGALIIIPMTFAIVVCFVQSMLLMLVMVIGWLQDRFDEGWVRVRPVQLPPDDVERQPTGPRLDLLYPSDLSSI